MNSYPAELLMQLAPVMFVAGLDPPAPSSPNPQSPTPQSPNPQSPNPAPRDPFISLTTRLRDALLARRKLTLWYPPSADPQNTLPFHVVLVDKNIRFPPRKYANPDDPHAQTHSPLSPLTPTSPLHPDGIIAPIWLRKHTTLVPSVFVLFTRLFEYVSTATRSPLDGPDPERELEERKRDEELSAEIAIRKKSTAERNVKLTVVLLASRKMLDDPSLDARLTFIRRHSGLDSRAALFVLSPVTQTELGEFVKSLQQALYEPALEYYTGHSKRVRRKRNRHANQPTPYTNSMSTVTRPLRPEGWTVRYEYKMACFAEFRGEADLALKHYQDAYSVLVIMFGSTAILPPRTKRWAEAKVLVDCINIKICKLYLYNNEHALALSQHHSHMRKFSDFSRGWGIGEDAFEYWSWLARQHRVFSELLEYGLRSRTLTIPIHIPLPPPPTSANINPGLREPTLMRGLNPTHALQHPGFYYYAAAKCTEMRRKKFTEAVDAEMAGKLSPNTLPGFANEKKVDHLAIIVELYTKAYDHFKQYTSEPQGRLLLWVAYRIAETYYEGGQFELAIKFFERISKTYKTENWDAMLRPLLSTWYNCARQLGDVELSVKLLVEMLFDGHYESEDPTALEEDLIAVLQSTVPSTGEAIVVELSDTNPTIFDCDIVFWKPKVMVGEPAAFQIWLTAPKYNSISSLPIPELLVEFDSTTLSIIHDPSLDRSVYIDIGEIKAGSETHREIKANLHWERGESIVIGGFGVAEKSMVFTVTNIVLRIQEGNWNIEVPFGPATSDGRPTPTQKWLRSRQPMHFITMQRGTSSSVNFTQRPHQLRTSFVHQAPAYVDEEFPISINVTNTDDRILDLVLDVLLQPCEVDDAMSKISLDEEQSSGLIKGVVLGTLEPGQTTSKTLQLSSSGNAGDRVLDISIQSRLAQSEEDSPASEHLQTIIIPTVSPFHTHTEVEYRHTLRALPALMDLRTFDGENWNAGDSGDARIRTSIECVGPWTIEIENIELLKMDHQRAQLTYASVKDSKDDFPAEYCAGDRYGVETCVSLRPDDDDPIDCPAEYEISWRRISEGTIPTNISKTRIHLPALEPPVNDLTALLDIPAMAKLHTPSAMRLIIRNRHPSKTAMVSVSLDFPPAGVDDPFVIAGMRSGRLPSLLPGAQQEIHWRIIPLECGQVAIPRIRVLDQRDADAEAEEVDGKPASLLGKEIRIVDMRLNGAVQTEPLTIMVVP